MNVGKLYYVVYTVVEELEVNNLVTLISNLQSHLQQSISQPNEQTSNQFKQTLQQIKEKCSICPSNNFTISERRILKRLNGEDKTGLGLYEKIKVTIDGNTLTPGNAVTELQKLNNETSQFFNNISSINTAFEKLEVEYEELEEDQYEIGYLLPQEIFEGTLEGFSKEIEKLDEFFVTVKEILGEDVTSL